MVMAIASAVITIRFMLPVNYERLSEMQKRKLMALAALAIEVEGFLDFLLCAVLVDADVADGT